MEKTRSPWSAGAEGIGKPRECRHRPMRPSQQLTSKRRFVILALGVGLTALTLVTASSAATLSKPSSKKGGAFTARSRECLGPIHVLTLERFGKCRPKLTLAAVRKFAVASVYQFPRLPPEPAPAPGVTITHPPVYNVLLQSYEETQEGDNLLYHASSQISFVAMSGCRRNFPHLHGDDGCSVITKDIHHEDTTVNGHLQSSSDSCYIRSENAVTVSPEAAGMSSASSGDSDTVVLNVKRPIRFQVVVDAFGPNPAGEQAAPC